MWLCTFNAFRVCYCFSFITLQSKQLFSKLFMLVWCDHVTAFLHAKAFNLVFICLFISSLIFNMIHRRTDRNGNKFLELLMRKNGCESCRNGLWTKAREFRKKELWKWSFITQKFQNKFSLCSWMNQLKLIWAL